MFDTDKEDKVKDEVVDVTGDPAGDDVVVDDKSSDVKDDTVKDESSDKDVKDTDVKDKKVSDSVPRERLNEELEKRKSLEREAAELRQQLASMRIPPIKRENLKAKERIQKLADEHFEGNLVAAEAYHKQMEGISEDIVSERLAGMEEKFTNLTSKMAVREIIGDDKVAQKYEADILAKLQEAPISARTNPETIRVAISIVKGIRFDEAVREAEQRGAKRSDEKMKIVTIDGNESASSSDDKKSVSLTPAERSMARRLGLTDEQYASGKKDK